MALYNRLTPLHLDMLKETGNIGAGHAATSMSELLNKKIEMKVPQVRVGSLNEVTEMIGGAERSVASIFLRIEGDAPGNMFFIVSVKEAKDMIRYLTDDPSFSLEGTPYSEIGFSAFREAGNILAGSYLSSLSDFTGLSLRPTPPSLSLDMAGSIVASGLSRISQYGDDVIIIDTSFLQLDEVKGHFLLLPDPESFEKIFGALGVPVDE